MATFSRGYTFQPDERLTPGKLNSLVSAGSLGSILSSELGPGLDSLFYGSADPGVTVPRIWYDTASGDEGLKYGFVSPSNASIAGWLYATPRREAYYWATSAVSLGTALFIGNPRSVESSAAIHLYDGVGLLRVHAASGSSTASESQPGLVVAMESVSAPGPIKCAWAGIIPGWLFGSQASLGNPLFVDNHDKPARFKSTTHIQGTNILTNLISYWHMNAGTGATRTDSQGTNHLNDAGATDVNSAAGLIGNAAVFNNSTSQKLEKADNSTLDFAAGTDATFSVWVKFDDFASNALVFAKNTNADNQREYNLVYHTGLDALLWQVFDGTGSPQTNHARVGIPTAQLTAGQWHNIVCWYDATSREIGIRLDDSSQTTASISGAFAGNSNFSVGLYGDNIQPMQGQIDELAFWKRLLTPAEKTALYNAGNGQLLSNFTFSPALSRSSVYGTVLQNTTQLTPGERSFLHWGGAPYRQDIVL